MDPWTPVSFPASDIVGLVIHTTWSIENLAWNFQLGE